MLSLLSDPFIEFSFMRRALVGCIAMSLGGTPVGVFMTLRNMSLTGDAMAHAILPGAAIGYLIAGLSLPAMTLGGIAAGVIVALLSGMVSRSCSINEDTNLAAFYLISLALGVLIISVRGSSVDLQHVLFGSILALDNPTLFLLSAIASLSLMLLLIFFRPLVMECCDPTFLKSESALSAPVHYLLLILVVFNLVAGFHAIGTLMAVGMMILPAAAARFWVKKLPGIILVACGICMCGSLFGLLISFYIDAPSSPCIILCLGGVYLLSYVFGSAQGQWLRLYPRPHLEN